MKELLNVITPLHKRTQRDYLSRMKDDKVHCVRVAKQYGKDFWDGDRRYGYGGYKYDGRWKGIAEKLIDRYDLPINARILDVGCGKGYLLYEFKKLLPGAQVVGFDISRYAIDNSKEEIRPYLFVHTTADKYPFGDKEFDLVISLMTLHNLKIDELKTALKEMQRVGTDKYLAVESYRDEVELFNLQCWALTCQAFFSSEEWIWLFNEFGYNGDYEFIFFE